ncbi:MAG: energy transducer TonB [Candidatus Cloacimonetes bacterium]|nr:energy transducer TonB [Candidatus Cloacimonadota bacterium]NLO11835.1 energy transducer TonB [Candidatus Cloacimonadota bacterium]
MENKMYDWKDVANAQFAKAVSLSLVLLMFVLMVTPNIEVRKQKFTTTQTELVDIPMEEREKLEPPPTEIQIDIPIVISDDLSEGQTDPELLAKHEQFLTEFGTPRPTTSLFDGEGEMVEFVAYDDPPVMIGELRVIYPESAKRTNTQGTVVLEVEVYRDGRIGNIHVRRSIIGLDQAAIDAVRKVKFQPGKSGGHPVDTMVIIPVDFQLN